MILQLVRHPRTVYGYEMCYGATDVAVDPEVMADAVARIRPLLSSDVPPQRWYASPLSRAANLARGLLGGEPVLDARVRELDFGDWELTPWDDLPIADVTKWGDDFVASPPPGGESFIELQERVVTFAIELLDAGVERAVVVTHSGPIRALTAWALGLPLGNAFRLEVGFAGVLELALSVDPVGNRLLSLR
ncbi:MAG: histidine phosphatase family protein [Propionibacteriaceae bacterium]|jgi:alpha-ribazole phosphatase|nr:histidine phosphatase family protein [Propionibacteriaceae bacterium]